MTLVIATSRRKRVLIGRPEGATAGRLGLDIATIIGRAQAEDANVYLLRPAVVEHPTLLALNARDVTLAEPGALTSAWFRFRWRVKRFSERLAERSAESWSAFWRELYLELRRHAGDDRLPSRLRGRLRDTGHALARRARVQGVRTVHPRQWLRRPTAMSLPEPLVRRGREIAARLGLGEGARIVAIDRAIDPDAMSQVAGFLEGQGISIVRVGNGLAEGVRRPGIVDVADAADDRELFEVYILLTCEFVLCGAAETQQIAYTTSTPSITVNAIDPFAAYPAREDGIYLLKTAVDLDTGRVLGPLDLLDEGYLRNLRNHGYRANSAHDILDAVREMQEGLAHGWREDESQVRYRARVVEAGTALADRFPHVAAWGPDGGFIGDGRLARVQARSAS